MKKIFYFLLFILNSHLLFAQAPNIQWQVTLGGSEFDYAQDIQKTTDGGYIMVGFSNSTDNDITGNHGGEDCWVVKLNSSGAVQWQKSFGGSSDDRGLSIKQTSDGGYIISGSTFSIDGDVTENQGASDYWILKLDSLGNMQWQKTYGNSLEDYARDIWQTADGGYIVAGDSASDIWILKLNSLGNLQWQKTLGGSGQESLKGIQETADNGFIISCWSNSNNGDVTGNHGGDDFWIVKLTSSGNIQWQKSLGGSGTDYAMDLNQTADGGYIIAGSSNSINGDVTQNYGDSDYWIVKTDSSGNIQWQKSYGGSNEDIAMSIRQTSDGGYIVAGYSNEYPWSNLHGTNYWIIKLNSSGTLQWENTLGGAARDEPVGIHETSDGGFIIGGYTASSGNGKVDYWAVKLAYPTTLGISEVKNNLISFYPNPARDFVYLNSLPGETTISLTDISGKKLFSQKYNETKVSVPVNQLINGTYVLQAEHKGKIILSEKLIIKK
ncbi:hypothetical protein HNP38_002930 [Chryseobacterium defluvii]|uniref:Secretion system C-terminal sorting domain-containing protein n=1 Tax=Chryseobacterium defluvii TaxID=160396 RepID=A0A840KIW4_9FLAO|nr:T9SS type A sorting domain-containing protein [Chryseobacterium defluvii]MBB4807624.1 hypothetical protein [Chryseobacterium defluvii]